MFQKADNAPLREHENIVLIGMPTCGKTTVGRLLSRILDRPFFDTDEVFASQTGRSSAECIREDGEAAFRAAESHIIRELSKQRGAVISTGGGSVLDRENVLALRQTGKLVFLDRSLDRLTPLRDRPLSSDPDKLAAMYEQRRPIYLASADLTINADKSFEETANEVIKELFGHKQTCTEENV